MKSYYTSILYYDNMQMQTYTACLWYARYY